MDLSSMCDSHLTWFPCQVKVTTAWDSYIISFRWAIHSAERACIVTGTTDTTGNCSATATGTKKVLIMYRTRSACGESCTPNTSYSTRLTRSPKCGSYYYILWNNVIMLIAHHLLCITYYQGRLTSLSCTTLLHNSFSINCVKMISISGMFWIKNGKHIA